MFKQLLLVCSFCLLLSNVNAYDTTNDYCNDCIIVIDTIKYYFEQNYTIAELDKLISMGCAYLGPGFSQICDFVADYGIRYLIKLINSLDSKGVCEFIYICPSRTRDIKCAVCKFTTLQILNYIEDDHTDEEIKKFITNICENAIYKYSDICISILDFGLDEFITFIKEYANADYICEFVKIC